MFRSRAQLGLNQMHTSRSKLQNLTLLPVLLSSHVKYAHGFTSNTISWERLHHHSRIPPVRTLHAFPPLENLIHSMNDLPFSQRGKDLFDELDIGSSLSSDVNKVAVPAVATSMVLESMGKDFLVFLAASVFVTSLATAVGITIILGYLIAGALLGPNALDVFSNTKADVELGDFGILFLLFSEGLEVTTSRLKKMTNYLPLGLAQISLTSGVLTASILLGAPDFIERFIPLDGGLINIHNPIEALVLALAGTLSMSAFVFPVLKGKIWEDEKSGEAATSVLLLQYWCFCLLMLGKT